MARDPDTPDTSAGDPSDIPSTMPPAEGAAAEVDDQPLGVDPDADTSEMPSIPDVGEGPTSG